MADNADFVRKKEARPKRKQSEGRPKTGRGLPLRFRTLAIFLFAVCILFIGVLVHSQGVGKPPLLESRFQSGLTLGDLIKMKPEELSKVDIATMNLLCATGLPGAENLDIAKCQSVLEVYASVVKRETEKYLPMYYHDPARFRNMEGFYRMQMLVTVIKKDLGVDYDRNRQNDESATTFFADSKDLFLNGWSFLRTPEHAPPCPS